MGTTRCATWHLYDKCSTCSYRDKYECHHEKAKPGNNMCCWMRAVRDKDLVTPKDCPLKEENKPVFAIDKHLKTLELLAEDYEDHVNEVSVLQEINGPDFVSCETEALQDNKDYLEALRFAIDGLKLLKELGNGMGIYKEKNT